MASQRASRSNSKVKILLLGAAEVGKTGALLLSLCDQKEKSMIPSGVYYLKREL